MATATRSAARPKPPRPPRNDPAARLAALRAIARERGGRCLARAYPGYQGRADYVCKLGHRWTTTSAIILGGGWCPDCRYRNPAKLAAIQAIARDRGGRCLSTEYPWHGDKLKFRCERGHEWEAEARKIREGHWCARCRRSLADMDAMVADRGGRCVSTKYVDFDTPLRWECARGHRFTSRPRNIRLGTWCQACRREDSWVAAVREIAASRGGVLLSERNLQSHKKLLWRCARGHEWRSAAGNILNDRWCPHCADTRLGIDEMRRMAAARAGKCISTHYVNRNTPLQWECAEGHRWWARPGNIRYQDTWCPDCALEARRAHLKSMAKDRR
ncbi:zinc-ribbon domain-containing protein [Nannocystis sp. SCPEA4]|uniref:zinc-ribbon domain-containing protein n=1 Tax=Nannocystis sp. SCPEA4 TaxID=2996787 RepID=UPI0022706263|nr:zinc-ribbon domain-containing protein [Nannocystis sp. SCPEA4]